MSVSDGCAAFGVQPREFSHAVTTTTREKFPMSVGKWKYKIVVGYVIRDMELRSKIQLLFCRVS